MYRQFESIKQQHKHRLYSYAWYSLRIAADAEDVVQEAFVKLWENWRDIDSAQAGAWLTRITQNLIVDYLRKRKASLPSTDADADLIAAEETQDAEQQRTMKCIVEHSIARLDDPYRTTVILREMQGLSYQEIAEVLRISIDHVRTDLFRGKRKLRELCKQHPLYHDELLRG